MKVALVFGDECPPELEGVAGPRLSLAAVERPRVVDPLDYVHLLIENARFAYAQFLYDELPDAVVVAAGAVLVVLQQIVPSHPVTMLAGEGDPHELAAVSCEPFDRTKLASVDPRVAEWRTAIRARRLRARAPEPALRFAIR
jgi:hypothetical protein